MKIGDRVTYNEPVCHDVGEEQSLVGTVVEPTTEDLELARRAYANDAAILGVEHGDVVVAWDDGERYWEHPSYLVVVREAGA